MTDTPHARSRRASLFGLVLQVIAVITAFVLAFAMHSPGMNQLAYFLVCGVPIWFIALLVFRQHELAALEAMDLDLLKREKAATGGGAALFEGEGGSGLGFLVAKQRLEWMQRWLVPFFGLVVAAYLGIAGVWGFLGLKGVLERSQGELAAVRHQEIGLVILVILTLLLFLYSRYASGMGRQREWQLLRACGSFLLANTLAAAALVICYGASLYSSGKLAFWEVGVAWAIPILMVVLAFETLLNFVLDIYRPRAPGTEPRACFDSRLLGLFSEPGGIAHSLAEAINYQFGFQVSQTWFYQLLVRVAFPLVWVAAISVWLLTSVFIVEPYEKAIVERFGEQIDPQNPLGPGIYAKWPWPIDVATKFNVDQLHQFAVGYKVGDTPGPDPELEKLKALGKVPVEQWTDDRHSGRDHFNFVSASPASDRGGASKPAVEGEQQQAPINLVRLEVFVQYKIRPDRLADLTQHTEKPDEILRNVTWDTVTQLCAGQTIDGLLDATKMHFGEEVQKRVNAQAEAMRLGLEVVYCGLINVHPEKTVSEAFRRVVTAQQEKIAEINRARVEARKLLVEMAGGDDRARTLARSIGGVQAAENQISVAEKELGQAGRAPAVVPRVVAASLKDKFAARFKAELALTLTRDRRDLIRQEYELGMGRSKREYELAQQAYEQQAAADQAAAKELEAALEPTRRQIAGGIEKSQTDAFLDAVRAWAALDFWNTQADHSLVGLEGVAAATLAAANAARWAEETRAATELTLVEIERDAYRRAPAVYKARRYLEVLTNGLKDARKYFTALSPDGRKLHIRLQTEETAQPDKTPPVKEVQ